MTPVLTLRLALAGLLCAHALAASRGAATDAHDLPTGATPATHATAVAFTAAATHTRSATDSLSAAVDTVAAIQFAPIAGDVAGNRARLTTLIDDAVARGARLVVLPELALSGPLADAAAEAAHAEPVPGPSTAYFERIAKARGIWIGLSLAERAPEDGYYLTSVLIDAHGAIAQRVRTVMVRPGTGARRGDFRDILDTVDADGMRIGILSGEDIRSGVPRLANRGADTILIAAAWRANGPIAWREVAESLAKKYEVNLIVANQRLPGEPDAADVDGVYSWLGGVIHARARDEDHAQLAPLGRRRLSWRSHSALGLPSIVPVPLYAGATADTAELGRRLFFDPKLSSTGTVACASCHAPERMFTNGAPRGVGVHGRSTKRNVPTLVNVAFRPLLQWDGYASSLENFAKYPISNVDEMDSHYLDKVPAYVRSDADYTRDFARVMRVDHVEFEHIAAALSAYLRTLISGDSAFDRFAFGGDRTALAADARRGLRLFTGKARCSTCHLVGDRTALFMDLKYHVTGVGYDASTGVFNDIGLGGISTAEQTGLFQTPSLREVARTAPYMHDGSLATLEAVIDYYARGGTREAPRLDPLMKPLALTPAEKRDLVAFLRALNGPQAYGADGRRMAASAANVRQGGQ